MVVEEEEEEEEADKEKREEEAEEGRAIVWTVWTESKRVFANTIYSLGE